MESVEQADSITSSRKITWPIRTRILMNLTYSGSRPARMTRKILQRWTTQVGVMTLGQYLVTKLSETRTIIIRIAQECWAKSMAWGRLLQTQGSLVGLGTGEIWGIGIVNRIAGEIKAVLCRMLG